MDLTRRCRHLGVAVIICTDVVQNVDERVSICEIRGRISINDLCVHVD